MRWVGRNKHLWPREALHFTDCDIEALLWAFNGQLFGPGMFEDAKAHMLEALRLTAASDDELLEEFGERAHERGIDLGIDAEGSYRMYDVAEKIEKLPGWLCAQLLGWVMGVHQGARAWSRDDFRP